MVVHLHALNVLDSDTNDFRSILSHEACHVRAHAVPTHTHNNQCALFLFHESNHDERKRGPQCAAGQTPKMRVNELGGMGRGEKGLEGWSNKPSNTLKCNVVRWTLGRQPLFHAVGGSWLEFGLLLGYPNQFSSGSFVLCGLFKPCARTKPFVRGKRAGARAGHSRKGMLQFPSSALSQKASVQCQHQFNVRTWHLACLHIHNFKLEDLVLTSGLSCRLSKRET